MISHKNIFIILFAIIIMSCNYGQLGGADKTEAFRPPDKTPTVSSVTVIALDDNVVRGSTVQFTVAVTGTNDPAQTVLWTIISSHQTETSISTGGLLAVSADETAISLKVRATSTEDTTKYGEAAVTVSNEAPPLTDPTISSVTVIALNENVARGSTVQFNVAVIGTNNPVQTVLWTIISSCQTGTSISAGGLLTVAGNETAASLKVRATSTADTTKYGEAAVTVTDSASPFNERMNFFCGVWYSQYPGTGLLDGYRIRKWSDLTAADKAKAQTLFPGININNPKTYSSFDSPRNSDYVLLYDDTLYGQDIDSGSGESWGFSYMGVVRAINIFNNDKNRGAIIIEYFEGADPAWLSDPDGYAYQGLAPGEKPFFGIYYRILDQDTVQMANAVDLAALNAGNHYYTEKGTLQEAIDYNNVENEAELISWGVVYPQHRVKEK